MRVAYLWASLFLACCGQESGSPPAGDSIQQQPSTAATPALEKPIAVEGWEADPQIYAKLGSTAPAFSGTPQGAVLAVTQDALRNRWTILGFAGPGANVEEARFVSALKSAVDQDPDLNFMAIADDAVATAFAVDRKPFYLLIGPDLTIEAWRGALSATPEDGIKPVIRGVAEIKRQIAAPT
jgi:hypothetical protein